MKKKSRRIKSLDHNNAPNNQTISDSDGGHQSPASVGRRRHTSSGQSQVRSLYDGLSHLYTDCDSRLRHIPTTNYAEKKKATNETSANETQENRVSCQNQFNLSILSDFRPFCLILSILSKFSILFNL